MTNSDNFDASEMVDPDRIELRDETGQLSGSAKTTGDDSEEPIVDVARIVSVYCFRLKIPSQFPVQSRTLVETEVKHGTL